VLRPHHGHRPAGGPDDGDCGRRDAPL